MKYSASTKSVSITGLLFAVGILLSCHNLASATTNEMADRCDTIFDVKGPVKSITYTVTNNFDDFSLGYYASRVEYTPQGHRWNIIGNENLDVNFFQMDESGMAINIVPDKLEGMDGNIVYTLDTLTRQLKTRVIQCAPEYDGCELAYSYVGDKLSKVKLTDFTYNMGKNGFDTHETVFTVNDGKLDEYGNWTTRELVSNKKTITISRAIDYYSKEQIPERYTMFEGNPIHEYETVGDFNGDGKIEKAWVKGIDDYDDMSSPIQLKIEFSDSSIQPVSLGEGLGFSLYNVGDINGDGCDDIGMTPWKMTSAWTDFRVWGSHKGNDWNLLTSFTIRDELMDYDRGEDFTPIQRKDDGTVEVCEALSGSIDESENLLYYYKVKKITLP